VAGIAGNLALAALLGMGPVLAQFFGLPLDVRHVTFAAGTLAAAAASLGWGSLFSADFWLAAGGIVATGLLNVGAAFICALMLALRAREVSARGRRLVWRSLARRLTSAPMSLLYVRNVEHELAVVPAEAAQSMAPEPRDRMRTGS
jgi:site-specific recombinase